MQLEQMIMYIVRNFAKHAYFFLLLLNYFKTLCTYCDIYMLATVVITSTSLGPNFPSLALHYSLQSCMIPQCILIFLHHAAA